MNAACSRLSDTALGNRRRSLFVSITLAIAIFTCVFIAFAPALNGQFISWDDDPNFLSNKHWRGLGFDQLKWMFTAFHMGHYQPITWLTLGFDYVRGGMDPRGYHLTNIVLHSVNAVLVFILALRLLSWALSGHSRDRSMSIQLGAAAAALLFGVHPLRVESVAWITERRDLVSGCLLLLTALAYLRSADSVPRRPRWLGGALALYVLSLMAKVSGVPLVAVLLALDWYPLRRSLREPAVWLEKIPIAIAAVLFALIAIIGQSHDQTLTAWARHPSSGRIAQSLYGLIFYLEKTIAPMHLLPLYELHLPIHPWDFKYIIPAILVLASAVAIVLGRKRAPALMTAMICYAALLAPVLGLVQTGPQMVADRYSYLPSIGLMIALAGGAVALWRWRRSAALAAAMIALAAFASITLGILTWHQCAVWRSTDSFWTYLIRNDPDGAYANNGYGWLLLTSGHSRESIPYLRNSIEINPWYENGFLNLWDALKQVGANDELAQSLEQAMGFANPYVRTDALVQRGFLAMERGEVAQALNEFEAALAITPDDSEAQRGLRIARDKSHNSSDQPARP